MSEINCNNCAISDFKESLCQRCDKMKRIGNADDIEKLIIGCLPSEQPERKKGKWIPVTIIYKVTEEQFPNTHIEWVDATEPDEIDGVRCSECDTVYDFIEARNWCSECGADMRGEQE